MAGGFNTRAKEQLSKTIVFCNTMNEIALVVNYLICELGKDVFLPDNVRQSKIIAYLEYFIRIHGRAVRIEC